jgi:hypothetical protein
MKYFALACAVTATMASLGWAADRPNQQILSDMGLGGITIMSDDEALSVRGMGWGSAKAYGKSWANVHVDGASAGSENAYSSSGKHKAWGESDSHAAVIIVKAKLGGGGHGGDNNDWSGGGDNHGGNSGNHGGSIKVKAVIAISGGSSKAGRK